MVQKIQWLRSNRGFTLVELMVVLVIIGILVAIAIPIYGAVQTNSRLTACKNNLRAMDGAIERWRVADPVNNTYADINSDGLPSLVSRGYLGGIPICPEGGEYHMILSRGVAYTTCTKLGHNYR